MRIRSLCLLAAVNVASVVVAAGCLDFSNLGGPHGPGGREGEGEGQNGGEGEGGHEGEGEGTGGEGEGGVVTGPRWVPVDAPISVQAELAGTADVLSSSSGRFFAVGTTHVFELVSGALTPIASAVVPCASASLVGPVVVDGTDVVVASQNGAVRFHDDGSCAPELAPTGSSLSVHALTTFAGGILLFDGQAVHLFDSNGTDVADHAFDTFTNGAFYADPSNAQAILLVRGDARSPGQEVRITEPATDLVVEIVADDVGLLSAGKSATFNVDSALGAPFLHVSTSTPSIGGTSTPTTVDFRLAPSDFVTTVASNANGLVAFAGSSALLARADVSASPVVVGSLSGERFGVPRKIAVSPDGDVWAAGSDVILHWTSALAASFSDPDVVYRDATLRPDAGIAAAGGSLFFVDNNGAFARADVNGATLVINELVDSVSFSPVNAQESRSAIAFLPAAGGAPDRLVEVGGIEVASFELTTDLSAVTAQLVTSTPIGTTANGVALLPDAKKAGIVAFSELFECALTFPAGQQPTMTCPTELSTGVSSTVALSIFDPSPGVDDETFILAGNGGIALFPPGASSATTFDVQTSGTVKPLLIHDCIVGFSSESWNALDQLAPLAPKSRRAFPVGDVAQVGDRILIVGGEEAGQISTIPAPADAHCNDASGAPILDGAAMLSNALRSQTGLTSVAFDGAQLYALDSDGVLWQLPSP